MPGAEARGMEKDIEAMVKKMNGDIATGWHWERVKILRAPIIYIYIFVYMYIYIYVKGN